MRQQHTKYGANNVEYSPVVSFIIALNGSCCKRVVIKNKINALKPNQVGVSTAPKITVTGVNTSTSAEAIFALIILISVAKEINDEYYYCNPRQCNVCMVMH
ncbi:hypothetical protein A6046_08235 [[Haemophilus] ducreyi]|uniref:Uncharacterized protein n=1 Tax=Haemophilus ducreyi TaxID=730 RepID=A0AAC8UCW9_HAEDC|nr:hypothetical protein RY60_04860 [[Haemophilus] ducreyi]AKO32492.1 hypothetical protein RZ57_04890 [[Haemophilus] ducreyi]AKO33943.1 hypothetical protein RZ58_04905 [[Haemophilus] ducreyi]AKO35390.1 hypothetical protein RZ59_04845 [[Haemophilus] ducreyi]AKO36823.1 hypothetical protein RZ61_04895 [[Haemophilus] ducreyi]